MNTMEEDERGNMSILTIIITHILASLPICHHHYLSSQCLSLGSNNESGLNRMKKCSYESLNDLIEPVLSFLLKRSDILGLGETSLSLLNLLMNVFLISCPMVLAAAWKLEGNTNNRNRDSSMSVICKWFSPVQHPFLTVTIFTVNAIAML